MDLSVFNLLMSTNPNTTATENMFSNAAQNNVPASADSSQTSLRTGEAFFEVLDQVRNGKTEKSANALYNAFSAGADASSSLKDFRKGTNETKENVKVVKLYIKRTRSSETLRKADEQKAKEAVAVQQSGQKIPTRENIAVAQETNAIQPEKSSDQTIVRGTGLIEVSIPEQAVKPQKKLLVPKEEPTAADILISSVLQTEKEIPQHTEQTVSEEHLSRQLPTEALELPSPDISERFVLPQMTDKNISAQILPKKQIQTQKTDISVSQEMVIPEHDDIILPPKQTETNTLQTGKIEENVFTVKEEAATNNFEKACFNQKDTVSAEKQMLRSTMQTLKKSVTHQIPQAETIDIEDAADFIQKETSRQSRHQAEQLAKQLPADTNITVTVETQFPTAKAFDLPLTTSFRSVENKKNSEKAVSTHDVFSHTNKTDISLPENDLTLTSDKPAHTTATQKQISQPETPNGLAVLSIENKVQSTSAVLSRTETLMTEAPQSSAQAPSAAVFSTGHQLKGKAVSGNIAVHKNVPVNELVDQIKVNIKKALKDGLDKIEIILKPKDLGTIKIRLEIGKDGTMKVVLNTARAETLDLLQSDLSALKQALTNNGFDLNDQSFSFNYRGERYNREHEQSQGRHNHFNPEESEDDTLIDSVPFAGSLSISGRYALNIRV